MPRVVEPDGGHDGLGDRAPVDPALDVGGVEPQVREPHAVEALPAERGDLGVQALAQARDLGLRHGRHAEGPRHLLDLARGDAEHVHLGHRGDERAVRPAVALYEVLGEERPRPQLRDPDPYVPRGREQAPLPVAVAAVGAPGAALAVGRPARLVGLRRDERVQEDLQAPPAERLQVGALLERREREPLHFRFVA